MKQILCYVSYVFAAYIRVTVFGDGRPMDDVSVLADNAPPPTARTGTRATKRLGRAGPYILGSLLRHAGSDVEHLPRLPGAHDFHPSYRRYLAHAPAPAHYEARYVACRAAR